MKFLDMEQREQIGFNYIVNELQILTPYGIEEKRHNILKPYKSSEKNILIKELENIGSIISSMKLNPQIYREINRLLNKVKDIKNSIKRCKNGDVLDDVELYEIKYFSLVVEELLRLMNKLQLNIKETEIKSLSIVVKLLDPEDKKIPTFYVYDSYSEKLKNIRKKKREIEHKIYKEYSDKMLTELKEERLNIVILEEEEELNIRRGLSRKLRELSLIIEHNIKSIGKIDFLIAKAKLAEKYGGVKPNICDSMNIFIADMFNPMVSSMLNKKGKKFTTISLDISSGSTVITGANMGGKSITLKTLALNVLLCNMGFYVFCKSASIPIFDFAYFVSDDMQCVSQGLSTFGAEIIKLKEIIEAAGEGKGFIAFDEFARGTNPEEGMNIVKALCIYLNNMPSISIISTHYDGVPDKNMVHYQVIGLKNTDFNTLKEKIAVSGKYSIEAIQEHMDYRLEKVTGENHVPRDALNICMLLGLDDEIVTMAKELYDSKRGNEYGKRN